MASQLIREWINIRILFPILGGLVPPLVWLYFWLKEDIHPEPKKRIIYTFLAGMLSVIPALFIEKFIYNLEGQTGILKSVEGIMIMLAAWALTEELAKFLAAFFAGLQKPECDEPIDPPIYLITAALGFAAMENIIFLTNAMARAGNTNLMPVLLTGDLRFIGANLLHVATSAFVGISLSLCFFHPSDRIRNLIGGTVLATILHFLFNYFIIKEQSNLDAIGMTKIMLPLWLIIVVIIFMLEKIKREKILEADKKI